jgi:hypothetical protein
LQNNTFEVTLYQSYAATETEATIYGLVGIQTTIKFRQLLQVLQRQARPHQNIRLQVLS